MNGKSSCMKHTHTSSWRSSANHRRASVPCINGERRAALARAHTAGMRYCSITLVSMKARNHELKRRTLCASTWSWPSNSTRKTQPVGTFSVRWLGVRARTHTHRSVAVHLRRHAHLSTTHRRVDIRDTANGHIRRGTRNILGCRAHTTELLQQESVVHRPMFS